MPQPTTQNLDEYFDALALAREEEKRARLELEEAAQARELAEEMACLAEAECLMLA